jgi:hypothetical protein
MVPCVGFGYGLWWIFPVIMIVMIIFCFFMMRRFGMRCWMGCCMRDKRGPHDQNDPSMTTGRPKEKMNETL